jgi:20S proteasome alpha/beta subunit
MLVLILLVVCLVICSSNNSKYDKSVNLFNPSGSLLQVEYATTASELGASLLCLPAVDGFVICCVHSEQSDLLLRRSNERITKAHSNAWITFAGIVGDGKYLMRDVRQFCTEFKLKLGIFPPAIAIAKHIGEIQHKFSYSGGNIKFQIYAMLFLNKQWSDHSAFMQLYWI